MEVYFMAQFLNPFYSWVISTIIFQQIVVFISSKIKLKNKLNKGVHAFTCRQKVLFLLDIQENKK